MMTLMWLSWLAYGGEVRLLGDRDYAVRAAAYSRLKVVGAQAVPALWLGLRDATPERRQRIELLLGRFRHWRWLLAEAVVYWRDASPAQVEAAGGLAAADAEFAACLFALIDGSGGFTSESSGRWCHLRPYMTGSLGGDISHCLRVTRVRTQCVEAPMPRATVAGFFDWHGGDR